MGLRRALASCAAAAAVAPVLAAAPAAAAKECTNLSLQESLDRGYRVAVVKVDDTLGGPLAKVRVLAQLGNELPETLTIRPGRVQPKGLEVYSKGYVAAVALQRDGEEWTRAFCDPLNFAEVMRKIEAEPKPLAGGPPVAYGVGAYGGSRVVALDAEGRTVAWDGREGVGTGLAVCPGGRAVVSVGGTAGGRSEVVVHDALTLAPRRLVMLPRLAKADLNGLPSTAPILAVHCTDAAGNVVQVLVARPEPGVRLYVVSGKRVRQRVVPDLDGREAVDASETANGFLVGSEAEAGKDLRLALIDLEGRRQASFGTPDVASFRGAISPDGKLLAYSTANISNPQVCVVDLGTKRELGVTHAPGLGARLGWTPSGELLVSAGDRFGLTARTVRFDNALRELRVDEVNERGEFAVVGENGVHFGSETIRVVGPGGRREIVNVRLAATTQIVAAGTAGFALEPVAEDGPGAGDPRAGKGHGTAEKAVAGGAAGAVAVAVAVALSLARRRRRSGSTEELTSR